VVDYDLLEKHELIIRSHTFLLSFWARTMDKNDYLFHEALAAAKQGINC